MLSLPSDSPFFDFISYLQASKIMKQTFTSRKWSRQRKSIAQALVFSRISATPLTS